MSKVLQNDEATICDVWIDKLRHDHKFPIVLTKVKELIIDPNGEAFITSLIIYFRPTWS